MSRAGFIGVSAPNTRRRRRQNTTAPITAIRVPASDILTSGQALQDTANWAAFLDPANYASVAGTIETVTVNYTGDTPDAVTPLWGNQINHFSITVEDSVGNTRTFATLPRTVAQTDLVLTFETTSDGETFTLPLFNAGTVNAVMQIDDGPEIAITAWNDEDLTQTIASAGIHTLRARGLLRSLRFSNDVTSAAKVRTVSNLGDLGWVDLTAAFSGCSGMTAFDAGTTDTSAVTAFNAMFRKCGSMVTCLLPANFVQSACTSFPRLFTQCAALTTAIDVSGWDVSNVQFMDEAFNGCTSMDFSNLRIDLWDLSSLEGFNDPIFNSMFNFLPDAAVLPTTIYDAFLIAQDAATLGAEQWFGLGQSVYTTGGAADAARTNLISKGYAVEDAGNATPGTAAAPTIDAVTETSITFTLPSDPFNNGMPISTWAGVTDGRGLDYREVGAGSWTRFGDGYTEGQSVAVTGLSADTEYEFRAVYANFNSVSEGVSNGQSASATTRASAGNAFTAEEEGSEPVITIDDSNPNALTFIVTGGNHPGTYTQNKADSDAAITVATLAVAPACLALPTISGTTTAGNNLTATPGLWVFAGADPGDQTRQWQNDTDGALTGETALTYRAQVTDVGDTLSVDETFGGVTVSSASTASIAAGDTTAPTLAYSSPADGYTNFEARGEPPQVPIIITFGQSNAVFLNNGSKVQDELDAIGRTNAIVVHQAQGGQSVSLPGGSWNVTTGDGDDTEGANYTALVAAVEAARVSNPNSYIAGAIWVQGEADAVAARPYFGPCKDMFEKLRTDLAEDFHITCLGLSSTLQTSLGEAGANHVTAEMQRMAREMPGVSVILADDVAAENGYTVGTAMRDGLHFSDPFLIDFAKDVLEQPVMRAALGLTSDLTLTFNETVVAGAGDFIIYNETGSFVQQSISVTDPIACNIAGSVMTLNPPSNLVSNRDYSIRWDAGAVKDLAGNLIAQNASSTFLNFDTNGDTTAPTLVPASCTPADGATDVAISDNITLIFNETVFAGSGNFYIYEDGVLSETIAVGSATIGTTDVVLNPVSNLSNNVDVSVRWDAGVVEDAAGNGVAANATNTLINFQTVAAAGFTPADLYSGDRGAYFIIEPSTCFTDSVGGTQAGIGDTVAAVSDQSGNGNHLSIPAGKTGPTLRQDGSSNYYLEFGAGTDQLAWTNGSGSAIPQPFTACVAYENTTLSVSVARLFRSSGNDAVSAHNGGNNPTMFAGSSVFSTDTISAAPAVRTDQYNGASSFIRFNANETTLNPGTNQLMDTGETMRIGNITTTNTGNPDIFFHLLIDRVLTSQEISDLESYVANRSGVTL